MSKLYMLIALLYIFFVISCKDDPNPGKTTVEAVSGIGDLKSNPWDTTLFKLQFWGDSSQNYGFDAKDDTNDVYISVENGKTNSFLRTSLYRIAPFPGTGGLVSQVLVNGSSGAKIRYTVHSSGAGVGSEKLVLKLDVPGPNNSTIWKDLSGYASHTAGKVPDVYVKVYDNATLPDVYVYKLYGTTVDITTDFKAYLSRICAQAVASVNNAPVDTPVVSNKNWDLNGNGKLDCWPDLLKAGTPHPDDEFVTLTAWAGPSGRNYWNNDKNGIVILEQEFIIHGSSGTIAGITTGDGKFAVIGGGESKKAVSHEYMHMLRETQHLYDIIDDEYNLMYYMGAWSDYEMLRYREFTMDPSGKQPQWSSVNGATF